MSVQIGKNLTSDYFRLHVDLLTNKTLKDNSLHVFENWGKMQAIKYTTNEDIATKFEADCTSLCKKCERKERTAVQISLQYLHWC